MGESCWIVVEGPELYQGDLLPNIHVPLFQTPFSSESQVGAETEKPTEVQAKDVLVLSQTCDLQNGKLRFVALCPVETIGELEEQQPHLAKRWKEVMKGRYEGLHLLGPCTETDYKAALIVDFREIISLPCGYVEKHASECGKRHRLKSPFLEHFSQAFGRFYMRVALPEFIEIP